MLAKLYRFGYEATVTDEPLKADEPQEFARFRGKCWQLAAIAARGGLLLPYLFELFVSHTGFVTEAI